MIRHPEARCVRVMDCGSYGRNDNAETYRLRHILTEEFIKR